MKKIILSGTLLMLSNIAFADNGYPVASLSEHMHFDGDKYYSLSILLRQDKDINEPLAAHMQFKETEHVNTVELNPEPSVVLGQEASLAEHMHFDN